MTTKNSPNYASHLARTRIRMDEKYAALGAVLNQIKLASGCIDCGYRGHPTALQFDHVRGEKIDDVSRIFSLKRALAEVEKCEVRCANCHSIKTWHWKQGLKKERRAKDLTLLGRTD